MKRILTLAAITMIALSALSGCTPSGGSSPSYTMTATVGGTAHTFTNVYAVYTASTGSVAITANNGTSTSTAAYPEFTTVVYSYTAPATYTINSSPGATNPGVEGTFAPDATMTDWKVASSGTTTISTFTSTVVTGSFSFTCVDGTVMTGTFTAHRLM